MKKFSKEQAIKEGLKHYFTGKPCKNNHISLRDVISSNCIECRAIWEENNKQKRAKQAKERRLKNPHRQKEVNKKSYYKNRERRLELAKQYRKERKDVVNASNRKIKAKKVQRFPVWANEEKIKEKYTLAKYFEFITLGIKYHVDHIVPLNGDTVCGLHVENNLQILRADQNLSKHNKWCWETQS